MNSVVFGGGDGFKAADMVSVEEEWKRRRRRKGEGEKEKDCAWIKSSHLLSELIHIRSHALPQPNTLSLAQPPSSSNTPW